MIAAFLTTFYIIIIIIIIVTICLECSNSNRLQIQPFLLVLSKTYWAQLFLSLYLEHRSSKTLRSFKTYCDNNNNKGGRRARFNVCLSLRDGWVDTKALCLYVGTTFRDLWGWWFYFNFYLIIKQKKVVKNAATFKTCCDK